MNVHGRVVSRWASGRNREPEILRKRAVAARGWRQTPTLVKFLSLLSSLRLSPPTDRGGIGNDRFAAEPQARSDL